MEDIYPRVMIIIDTHRLGGPGKGLLQFLRIPKNFDYCLYCIKYSSQNKNSFAKEAIKKNINIRFFKQAFNFDPMVFLQVISEARKNKFNIIQTHGYKADILGLAAKKILQICWISFAHGFTSENFRVKMYHRLDRSILGKADKIVAVSESIKDTLTQDNLGSEKITVIHNAVDLNDYSIDKPFEDVREKFGLSPNKPLIGVIGRFSHEKGQFVFLKALKIALEDSKNFQAVLIGEGPDQQLLNDYIKNNNLDATVKLIEYQSDIVSWYKALDLLVLPSLSEGLPNVILEAMLFNVPVIATDVGAISSIIDGTNGIIVPPGHPGRLAEQIKDLLSNPKKRKLLALKASQMLYPEFSSIERSKAIQSIYQEVLHHKTSPN